MATQLLARRSLYGASSSRQAASRRSRPYQLVVKAYLPNAAQTPDVQPDAKKTIKLPANPDAAKPQGPKAKVAFQTPRHVDYGQDICLVGEDPALGEWDVSKCVPMDWHEGDVWTAEAELPEGAKIEYKYVRRAAEDMGGDVIEWLPEPINLALQIGGPEVTVRDGWVGESHEILPGLLPVPPPPPPAETVDEGAEVVAAMTDAPTAAPTAPAADIPPPFTATAAAEAPIYAQPQPTISSAPVTPDDPVLAEDVAGSPAAAAADAAVPRAGSESDTEVWTAEEIAATERVAAAGANPGAAAADAAIAVDAGRATPPAAASLGRKTRRGNTEGRNTKAFGSRNTVAAASVSKASEWAGLATSDLKELCKERGLPVKGQRRELIAKLQQQQQK